MPCPTTAFILSVVEGRFLSVAEGQDKRSRWVRQQELPIINNIINPSPPYNSDTTGFDMT